MTTAQRLHLRLFLEGVEVPVISATVQSQPNVAAACSIQIPANDMAMLLRPRTLVHLYFYDLYRGAPPSDRAWVEGQSTSFRETNRDPDLEGLIPPERFASTDAQEEKDLLNQNYRLLFGGELVGVNLDKTPMTRSITLQCLDWSMYWDNAFQYQISSFNFSGGSSNAGFSGAATTVFNSFLDGSGDIVMGLMTTAPRSYPKLKGTLLGAIVHIIEAIGGINFGPRSIRGANDFFSIAELRLKLTQMVGANPFEQNAETRLMSANGFGGLFSRALSGLGKRVSIRAILQALQRYIFHEIIPVTSPHFIPSLADPNLPVFATTSINANADYLPLVQAATQLKQRADRISDRQKASTDPVTAKSLSAQGGGLAQELRQLKRVCLRATKLARKLALKGGEDFFADFEVNGAILFGMIDEQTRRGQRVDVRTNTFYPPETIQGQEVIRLCETISATMTGVLQAQIRTRILSKNHQADPPARLFTQIYRPDVWMVAPPRCNVLFPELYSSFSYGRSFMDEVTRLMLKTHEVFYGPDILFDGSYMAPNRVPGSRTNERIARGRNGIDPPDLSDAPAWFIRDMMDHELYTGIIPKFERMSDLNLHALRGGSITVNPQDGGAGVKMSYAQLAANHIFYQYRFKSRQLNVQGKFNPYFVLGFPSLVIDKYKPVDTGDQAAAANWAVIQKISDATWEGEGVIPGSADFNRELGAGVQRTQTLVEQLIEPVISSHYLGTPAALTHTVSAETGGTSQMQMTYARSTDERMEFLGDDRVAPKRYRRARNRDVSTVVAMYEVPVAGRSGPRGGEIYRVEDITEQFSLSHPVRRVRGRRSTSAVGTERYTSDERLPLFIPGGRSGRRGTRVPIGTPVPTASVPEVAAISGSVGTQQATHVTTVQGNISRSDDPELGTTSAAVTMDRTAYTTFSAYKIWEHIGIYERDTIDLPAEDLVFPPWYGESYRSQNIGALYGYFFGTGSIVDPLNIVGPGRRPLAQADGGDVSGASAVPNPTPPSLEQPPLTHPDTPDPVVGATTGEVSGAPGTAATDTTVPVHGSIENAVTELVQAYSLIRRNKFDVDDFLRSYTWRPIASMVDMFGTANLEIDSDGEVRQGVEGFHSRAFGDFDDLRQLTATVGGERVATVLGLTTTDSDEATGAAATRPLRDEARAARLDTRKEKRLAVFKYIQALLATRGILG